MKFFEKDRETYVVIEGQEYKVEKDVISDTTAADVKNFNKEFTDNLVFVKSPDGKLMGAFDKTTEKLIYPFMFPEIQPFNDKYFIGITRNDDKNLKNAGVGSTNEGLYAVDRTPVIPISDRRGITAKISTAHIQIVNGKKVRVFQPEFPCLAVIVFDNRLIDWKHQKLPVNLEMKDIDKIYSVNHKIEEARKLVKEAYEEGCSEKRLNKFASEVTKLAENTVKNNKNEVDIFENFSK